MNEGPGRTDVLAPGPHPEQLVATAARHDVWIRCKEYCEIGFPLLPGPSRWNAAFACANRHVLLRRRRPANRYYTIRRTRARERSSPPSAHPKTSARVARRAVAPRRTSKSTKTVAEGHLPAARSRRRFRMCRRSRRSFARACSSEPIVPVGGTPATEENTLLAQALTAFHRDGPGNVESQSRSIPCSVSKRQVWRPSLLAGLGEVQAQGHQDGQALRSWDEAWKLAKDDLPSTRGRAVADYAVAEWLTLSAGEMGLTHSGSRTVARLRRPVRCRDPALLIPRFARARSSRRNLVLLYPDRITLCGPCSPRGNDERP